MKKRFFINPDIKKAETLPATFYRDADIFKEIKEKIFVKNSFLIIANVTLCLVRFRNAELSD